MSSLASQFPTLLCEYIFYLLFRFVSLIKLLQLLRGPAERNRRNEDGTGRLSPQLPVKGSVLYGFGNVVAGDFFDARQISNGYLWKANQYPTQPRHIGEQIKKRWFDLKMTAVECRKILGVDKSTLTDWESGKHRPKLKQYSAITRLLRAI